MPDRKDYYDKGITLKYSNKTTLNRSAMLNEPYNKDKGSCDDYFCNRFNRINRL